MRYIYIYDVKSQNYKDKKWKFKSDKRKIKRIIESPNFDIQMWNYEIKMSFYI